MENEQDRFVTMIVAYTILSDSQVLSRENQEIRRHPIVENGFKAIIARLNLYVKPWSRRNDV